MSYNPFAKKTKFSAFVVDGPDGVCSKCHTSQVSIQPTTNCHAAVAKCASCNRFLKWLGGNELKTLLSSVHDSAKR